MTSNIGFLLIFLIFFESGCKPRTEVSSVKKSIDDESGFTQIARFAVWLTSLDKTLESAKTEDEAAKAIVKGSARIAAYHLQALGRIYQDQDPWFKDTLRAEFEEVENAIGEYDKWNNILMAGQAIKPADQSQLAEFCALNPGSSLSPSSKIKIKRNCEEAVTTVKTLLKKRDWFGSTKRRSDKIRKQLGKIHWHSIKKDRDKVLSHISNELKEMKNNKYQFKNLEKGLGLHELRRDMKWILLEMKAHNGLVLKDPNATCPVDAFKDVKNFFTPTLPNGAPNPRVKYDNLKPSAEETDPCYITECLYLELVKAVDDFGNLKNSAEFQDNTTSIEISDAVPQDIKVKAEGFFKTINDAKLFDKLQEEIKACVR
jgi:hypothetical protein